MGSNEAWDVENEIIFDSSNESRVIKTAHSLSSSSLRKKSNPSLGLNIRFLLLRQMLINLQEVIFGTKICILFVAIPFAIVAQYHNFGRPWVFAFSLLGLAPLAERVSYLTEQIAYYTGSTVGGLLNATCGNATELIIAIFALWQGKIAVLKYSLLGSILSNLLLVLGSSLFCGGLANISKEQKFDRSQADVNVLLLLLGILCHALPLLSQFSEEAAGTSHANSILLLSRVSSVVLLVAYMAYLFFQLKTHQQLFDSGEDLDENDEDDKAVIGFWSAFSWLVGMTAVIALLSEFVVGTIEAASISWGIPISFLSIILLPIVGNAAEHAGAIIFAYKNKLDISLGVALGSATQISIFVVPLCVIVAWIMHIKMDLSLTVLETGSLAVSVLILAFTLQDGSSHYMKGAVLLFAYMVIATSFLVLPSTIDQGNLIGSGFESSVGFSAA
ncbi:vacuolar cation/proton exchanger 3 isoform X2 [Beta vulgaris subsp. vulgaris]|uniref:vacuolar cation/proton exchanger 3 isoform X2 n=1 Tax=Beta vulgaris subsp. vulgaris TaxID=3555 RepID=UPI00053F5E45|nr:vacuolar cation/proton exchanger 3 isoform X2 [Beta vulgaris subsp. vulgaris]